MNFSFLNWIYLLIEHLSIENTLLNFNFYIFNLSQSIFGYFVGIWYIFFGFFLIIFLFFVFSLFSFFYFLFFLYEDPKTWVTTVEKKNCKRPNRHHHFQGGTSHVRTPGEPWILELEPSYTAPARSWLWKSFGKTQILAT